MRPIDLHAAAPIRSWREAIADAADRLWREAEALDHEDADAGALLRPLMEAGLTRAVLPREDGGVGLASDPRAAGALMDALRIVGGANLSAGRLFEGHANATKLVFTYGSPSVKARFAAAVREGGVSGVWNAESPPGLAYAPDGDGVVLHGAKIFASGAGTLSLPLVTARAVAGEPPQMLLVEPQPGWRGDLSAWRVSGMRATATGTADLTGMRVGLEGLVGAPGDYYRAPLFKGGAWRFCAVQLGAMERLYALVRGELAARGRAADAHQRARLGGAFLAVETARLWVERACLKAEGEGEDVADAEAYVNLARTAVERAAMELIALAQRTLGLSALTRPNPVERVVRDLSTYLRQPFPDGALDEAAARLAAAPGPLHPPYRPGEGG